jgi:hypothetical protein
LQISDLEPWIDEDLVRSLWFQMGEQVHVTMFTEESLDIAGYRIRDKSRFVDFGSPQAAAKALLLNETPMPNSSRLFMLG